VSANRVARIRALLEAAFSPQSLEIVDDSHLHAGHVGAQSGKGHYTVRIVSSVFHNTRPLDRHRMIFEALDDLMKTDIHALRVFASPPEPKRQPSTTKDVHENSSS
jgi:BolA protein